MKFILGPWHLLLLKLAAWVNREQQAVIEYLRTENQVLREKLGKRRILLSDDQRRRLAVKGKVLGRHMLEEVDTLFTPDTILRWHRMLVAEKWDYSERRKNAGRPPVPEGVVQLALQMARENPTWGYDRIVGALANLGHTISDQSVGIILNAAGHRTRAGSEANDHVVDIPESSLGHARRDRFHDRRSLDQRRTHYLLSAVRDGTENPPRPCCRLHGQSR